MGLWGNKGKKNIILKAALSALSVFLLFGALCAFLHITPFGDKTFLYEDMKQQYVDFFSYYHNVWHGKDGFLYSDNCGLGSDMFGIWAYYLTSPFLFMFAFLPDVYYAVAVTFLIGFKLAAMAATTSVFFSYIGRNYSERREVIVNVMVSLAFSFSAWMIANMTNIMWLDAVIVMPILLVGLLKMLRSEKSGRLIYVISVMVMVVMNYYIATMILMFSGMFTLLFVGIMERNFKEKSQLYIRFVAHTFLGLFLDAWFLIPTAMSLMGSNKDHSGAMANAFSEYLPSSEAVGRNLSPISVIPKLFTMSYDSLEIMNGLPNIYFGAVLIIPCILFFINKKIERRTKMMLGGFLAVIMMFFCIKPLNTLAHGGTEAYGYLYRYSFVFSFVCLAMVYLCMVNAEEITIGSVLMSGLVAVVMFAVSFFIKPGYMGTKAWIINAGLLFVSEAVLLIMVLLKNTEKRALELACLFIAAVLFADISSNFICIYRNSSMNAEGGANYTAKCEETRRALDSLSGDYRIEALTPRTPNDSLHYGYMGTTTYNSLLKVENRLFMYKLGFNDNGLYTMYDADNTACADAILGIKYLIGDAGEVIENANVLPSSYISGEKIPELLEEIEDAGNPFDAQERLWNKFTGQSSDIFYDAEVVHVSDITEGGNGVNLDKNIQEDNAESVFDTENSDNNGNYEFKIIPVCDGELYFYMKREGTTERSLALYVNGEFLSGYGNASCQKVINLGNFSKGEEVSLVIEDGDQMGYLPGEILVVTEDVSALEHD